DVTDLQDAVVLLGKLDQFRRLGSVVSHRLLDQHVLALLKQQFGEFVVDRRRCYDAQPIARRGGFGKGIESLHAVFLRNLPRSVRYLTVVIAAYILGSIPTGYLVARAKGVDIRTVGSGNIGATNVFRILGKPAGIFVLVFDGLKGFAGCAWLVDAVIQAFQASPEEPEYLRIAGLAVIL